MEKYRKKDRQDWKEIRRFKDEKCSEAANWGIQNVEMESK